MRLSAKSKGIPLSNAPIQRKTEVVLMLLWPFGQLPQKVQLVAIRQKDIPLLVPAHRHMADRALISPSEFPSCAANISHPPIHCHY